MLGVASAAAVVQLVPEGGDPEKAVLPVTPVALALLNRTRDPVPPARDEAHALSSSQAKPHLAHFNELPTDTARALANPF